MPVAVKTVEIVKKCWDGAARTCNLTLAFIERLCFGNWRQLLWSKAEGTHILEVGVGTGNNFPYYPPQAGITAIDFSGKMLEQAKRRAVRSNVEVYLQEMDVQNLEFGDNTFDTVVGSYLFCMVPDPVRGLIEIKRVCKPGGKVVLLEHVLSNNRALAWLMNLVNPLVLRMFGDNINRKTVVNVCKSGLIIEQVSDLEGDTVRLIEARKRKDHQEMIVSHSMSK